MPGIDVTAAQARSGRQSLKSVSIAYCGLVSTGPYLPKQLGGGGYSGFASLNAEAFLQSYGENVVVYILRQI